jgi:hypothetical protein
LGTPVIWGHPGGTGVTNNLSLNNLATGSARMGVYVDLGALYEQEYLVYLYAESGTAPTLGTVIELYLASTNDNTVWPSSIDGTDAAYTGNRFQLGEPICLLYAVNTANLVQRQNPVIWTPPGRYVAPLYMNSFDQNLRNQGTPANNGSRVILVPRQVTIES